MTGASPVRTFRDLIAWQRAMDVARAVYRMTMEMPRDERFGLVLQLRRAAVSIPSNIAEGHARGSTADYARFLRIARGSFAEVATQIELAESLGFVRVEEATRALLSEADRLLQALIMSIERRLGEEP